MVLTRPDRKPGTVWVYAFWEEPARRKTSALTEVLFVRTFYTVKRNCSKNFTAETAQWWHDWQTAFQLNVEELEQRNLLVFFLLIEKLLCAFVLKKLTTYVKDGAETHWVWMSQKEAEGARASLKKEGVLHSHLGPQWWRQLDRWSQVPVSTWSWGWALPRCVCHIVLQLFLFVILTSCGTNRVQQIQSPWRWMASHAQPSGSGLTVWAT